MNKFEKCYLVELIIGLTNKLYFLILEDKKTRKQDIIDRCERELRNVVDIDREEDQERSEMILERLYCISFLMEEVLNLSYIHWICYYFAHNHDDNDFLYEQFGFVLERLVKIYPGDCRKEAKEAIERALQYNRENNLILYYFRGSNYHLNSATI